MQETPRSLGLFFQLTGGFGSLALLGVLGVLNNYGPGKTFAVLFAAAIGSISLYNYWIGRNLARLLAERPHIPLRFATLGACLAGLLFVSLPNLLTLIAVFLNLYIVYQLKRLATEADVKLESQILE